MPIIYIYYQFSTYHHSVPMYHLYIIHTLSSCLPIYVSVFYVSYVDPLSSYISYLFPTYQQQQLGITDIPAL